MPKWVIRYVEVQNLPTMMFQQNEDEQHTQSVSLATVKKSTETIWLTWFRRDIFRA